MANTIKARTKGLSDCLPPVKPVKVHSQRLTQSFVSGEFEKRGWKLVSEYENWESKLEFICDQGNRHKTTLNTFRQFKGIKSTCGRCARRVITQDLAEKAFQEAGYTLLSTYISAMLPLQFICEQGHSHSIPWNEFNKGTRCGQCKRSGYNSMVAGRLYYVRFDFPGFSLWKIGISNHSIAKRFKSERVKPVVLMDSWYADGSKPPKLETEIKRKHKTHKYNGATLQKGNSDCFTIDVLELDREAGHGVACRSLTAE
jgi:bacterioferritin-associated ferredoxin